MEMGSEMRMFFVLAMAVGVSVILPVAAVVATLLERGAPAERAIPARGSVGHRADPRAQRRLERELGLREAQWRLRC